MKLTRTWIDTHLSQGQRKQLVEWLLERSQNPTGEMILAGLQELFPDWGAEDLPSLQSCIAWRNKAWAFELHRRELREETLAAKALADAGDGTKLDEANRVMLQSLFFTQLRALKEGRVEEVDPEMLEKLAKNVAVLARQGMAERELAVKLELMEKEKEAAAKALASAKATASDDSLTPAERLAKIRKGLKV